MKDRTCSLGQDGAVPCTGSQSFLPGGPLPVSSTRTTVIPSSSSNPCGIDRRGKNSYYCVFRKASTDAPATASTPGKDCLTARTGFAKGILASISRFRARFSFRPVPFDRIGDFFTSHPAFRPDIGTLSDRDSPGHEKAEQTGICPALQIFDGQSISPERCSARP